MNTDKAINLFCFYTVFLTVKNMELKSRILKCKEQINKNNAELKRLSNENERLLKSLMVMMTILPNDKKQRYDKELASDGWKKTDYYIKNMKRFESEN